MEKEVYEVINGEEVLVYEKTESGWERSWEHDSNGNVIHYKDNYGMEMWSEYDSNNHEIHCWNNEGWEQWQEYAANGKMSHLKNKGGIEGDYEIYREYDSDCEVIHYKDTRWNIDWFADDYDQRRA